MYEVQSPHDVQLWFSTSNGEGLALWTSATLLAAVSPYFKTMLNSEFKEGIVPSNNGGRVAETVFATDSASVGPVNNDDHSSDSDAELNTVYKANPPKLKLAAADTPRRITITKASYATYKSLLSWLLTGQITFAPPSAAFATPAARQSYFGNQQNSHPYRPLPCSSKSIYKLAHLLEIPALAQIALDAYIDQLDPKFAHEEVFSSMLLYDDAKARLVEYARTNKQVIKDAGGFEKVAAALGRGELEGVEREVSQVLAGLV